VTTGVIRNWSKSKSSSDLSSDKDPKSKGGHIVNDDLRGVTRAYERYWSADEERFG
jgi:hypothetical protein